MRTSRRYVLAMVFVSACGADVGPDAVPVGILAPPADGEGVQIGLDVTIEPGEDIEYCRYATLPEGEDLAVGRVEHAYSSGSHHLIVFATTLTPDQARTDTFPCPGSLVELGMDGITYAAQQPSGELQFPAATALTMPSDRVVLMQVHYLNPTDRPIDAEVRVNLWRAQEPVTVQAGTLFFYNWAILVPPRQESVARMRCTVPSDIELVFATSHMHRRGIGFRSWVEGTDRPEPLTLHDTGEWQDVEPRVFDPVQHVGAGEAIQFECDYRGEERPIIEGPSALDNEMCVFVAAYYPKLESSAVERCFGPGAGPVFDGDKTCGQTLQCFINAADEMVAEQCLLDTCHASGDEASALIACMYDHCRDVCESNAGMCQQCMVSSCQAPINGCLSATCDES